MPVDRLLDVIDRHAIASPCSVATVEVASKLGMLSMQHFSIYEQGQWLVWYR